MKKKLTIKAFEDYIEEFKHWQSKRLPWYLKTILYLPVGFLIENYWINQMHKTTEKYQKDYL